MPHENGNTPTSLNGNGINQNGHYSPDEVVETPTYNPNSSQRLSENGYDSIAELGIDDELGSSEEGSEEDVFLANEELERRRNKKEKDNNNGISDNAPHLNGHHTEYNANLQQHQEEKVVDGQYDYIEGASSEGEPGTILSSDQEGEDYYFEEGSSVNGERDENLSDSEQPTRSGFETEDYSSIPRFEDVIAPNKDTEPNYDDMSEFPDLGIYYYNDVNIVSRI